MRRRRLLTATGSAILAGGCLELAPRAGRRPPSYDCEAAARSDPPTTAQTVRGEYPSPPPSVSDEFAVLQYLRTYERAYRLNDLRRDYGGEVDSFDWSLSDTWLFDAPGEAIVGRLAYGYSFTVRRDDESVRGDSRVNYVSYYLSESVLLRAFTRELPVDETALDPDPWTTGRPVECFD